jgi:hypothetical protein
MSNYVVSDTSLGSVADAIRNKGKTSELLEYPQGFIDAIEAIGKDEPVPEDGKTRIWIRIPEDTPDNRLTFYLRFTASTANNTTVDWGDGVSETLGSTTATNYSHKYPSGGNYVITMTVNRGTIYFVGDSSNSIFGARDISAVNVHNRLAIKRIIFGDDVTAINANTCMHCYSLESVTLPDGITSIGDNTFSGCYSLESIIIPDGVEDIGVTAFFYCYRLTSITIPDSVTALGGGAFSACYSMSEYHFKRTTPPLLGNANVFNGIPSDCIIYVPKGSLSAYKTATNWSTYASQMREEPT